MVGWKAGRDPLPSGRDESDCESVESVPPSKATWKRQRLPAALAGLLWMVDGIHHTVTDVPGDMLWMCNIALLLTALGLACRCAPLCTVAFAWLVFGTPIWIVDLFTGGQALVMSFFSHFGGLALAIYSLWTLGVARGSWWQGTLGFLALQQLCRWVTPPDLNVNLAHGVWVGWEDAFPSYFWYMAMLIAIGLAVSWGMELLLAKLLGRPDRPVVRPPREPGPRSEETPDAGTPR